MSGKPSKLESIMAFYIKATKLPAPECEYRFCKRRWRFDFAWPDFQIAAEVHGSTYANGRHTRGAGYQRDREKMNEAQLMGWIVLEFTAGHVSSGYAIQAIERALRLREAIP